MRQLIACLLASITLTAWAEAPVVEHRVRFPDRLNQYVDVQLRIPAEAGFDGLPHLLAVGYHEPVSAVSQAPLPLSAVA